MQKSLIVLLDFRASLLLYKSRVTAFGIDFASGSVSIFPQSLAGSTGLWFIAETALFA